MHIPGDYSVTRLHPKFACTGDTPSSKLHEEKAVRDPATADRVQREVEWALSISICPSGDRLIALDPHQTQSARGQT